MSKNFVIKFREKNCKQCGICSYFCPGKVLEQSAGKYPRVVRAEACIGCRLCEMRCPDFAIEVEVETSER
ncbi:MAG: 4Fe-4S binding protein [Clostridiales bacterium]|nr:4Fe-4S binding protein [Clostridiales bacterium]